MQTIPVYRYTRPDGGVSVSPVKPEGECTELYRLVADEGMVLTDGVNYAACADTAKPELWYEVPDPDHDPGDEDEAEDMRSALLELGVNPEA